MPTDAMPGQQVECLLAGESVSAAFCSQEQDARGCSGCRAPTRRCTACGKTRGIVDARRGRCGVCAPSEDATAQRPEAQADVSLERMLDRVRGLGHPPVRIALGRVAHAVAQLPPRDAAVLQLRLGIGAPEAKTLRDVGAHLGLTRERIRQIEEKALTTLQKEFGITAEEIQQVAKSTVSASSSSASSLPRSPLVDHPESLLRCLMEHATERDGEWRVSAPLAILRSREPLLPEECRLVLEGLVAQGLIHGQEPWGVITLLTTEGMKEAQDAVALSAQQAAGASAKLQLPPSRRGRRTRTAPLPASAPRTPLAAPERERPTARPVKQSAIYADIYAHLMSRSNEIRGTRVVGGALPLIQIRFKLDIGEATRALERLEANDHVARKDGWRMIVLKSAEVTAQDSSRMTAQPGTPAGRPPQARPRTERGAIASPPASGADGVSTVDNRVRALRLENDLTQEALALAVGVSRQTVCSMEQGGYVPSVALAQRLARYFGCSVEHLFPSQRETPTVEARAGASGPSSSPSQPARSRRRGMRNADVPVGVPSGDRDALAAAIDALERDIPLLRAYRDEVAQKIAELEVALATLKTLRAQAGEPDGGMTRRMLAEATRTARGLLAAIRGSHGD